MAEHKIVFTGPVGAGKTTAIASISDIPPVRTEARSRDMQRAPKEVTTVAMDYGLLRLAGGEKVHLYGTPGQARFDFMWDILAEGAIGLVLLVNNDARRALRAVDHFLEAFRPQQRGVGLALGVTRMDISADPTLADYNHRLRQHGLRAPVLEVDARQRRDVALLLQALLYEIDPGLDGRPAAGGGRPR